jgi:hypothetical protein
MLISLNVDGNVHATTNYLNINGLSRFAMQISSVGSASIAVLKLDKFKEAQYVCGVLGRKCPTMCEWNENMLGEVVWDEN